MLDIAHINLTFKHLPGIKNCVTDFRSRHPRNSFEATTEDESDISLRLGVRTVRAQEQNLEPVDPRLEKMADNALMDNEYQTMIRNILEETPLHELDRSGELFKMGSERQYLGVWTFSNGSKLVVKNSSEVVVPKGDRQEVLDELHATHMGVEGMKKLARGKMTWKNMTKDFE